MKISALAPALLATLPSAYAGGAYPDAPPARRAPRAVEIAAPCVPGACDTLVWEARASLPLNPLGIEGSATGVVGTRIYVMHGHSGGDQAILRIYDTLTDSWSLGPSPSQARSEGTGVAIGTRTYSIGGRGFGSVVSDLEIYDTTTSTWSVGTPMPTARAGMGAAVVGGRIHVVGGRLDSFPEGFNVLSTHEVYDPATDSWSAAPSLPLAVGDCYATVAIGSRIYVLGGFDGAAPTNVVQVFDTTTSAWSVVAPMPTPRSNAVAGVIAGRIVVVGGLDTTRMNSDVTEIYDPATDTWCTGPSKPRPASELGVSDAVVGDALYAIGSGARGASHDMHDRLVLAIDTTPPAIACPADLVLECPADPARIQAWRDSATATDDCATPVVTSRVRSRAQGCGAAYEEVWTFTATDDAGNTATCEATLRVEDTTAPTLAGVPADVTVSCESVPPPASPTATDACDGAVGVVLAERLIGGACAHSYVLERTWTATDACGNAVSAIQRVTVEDRTPPVLSGVPADVTVSCAAVPPPASPTASDNCDTAPRVAFTERRIDGSCPDSYVLERTWTATDACGNAVSATQRVTVEDRVAPVLAGVPADETVECDAVPPPATPTATDDCDPAPVVTLTETRTGGACPGEYEIRRTWTATDRCGNSSSATQVLAVVDTTPPTVTASADQVACLWPPNHRYVCFFPGDLAPGITDACSEPVTWRFEGCASDQPDEAPDPAAPGWNGDGSTTDDCVVATDGSWACVRSERAGTGASAQDGRHYGLAIVAVDACGNASAPVVVGTVHVPHDQSPAERGCLDPTKVGCGPNDEPPCARE